MYLKYYIKFIEIIKWGYVLTFNDLDFIAQAFYVHIKTCDERKL